MPIEVDAVVTIRSSVLPIYVVIEDGKVTAKDEVSQYDFLTTIQEDGSVALRSYEGDFLSVQDGQVCTSRFLGPTERFVMEQVQFQYSLRSCEGTFLSVSEREPYVQLKGEVESTEMFQLFSLMIDDLNIGKQLQCLTSKGSVLISNLLAPQKVQEIKDLVGSLEPQGDKRVHDVVVSGLLDKVPELINQAAHPLVMQILRRHLSPRMNLSACRCVWTEPRAVRMDLDRTTWEVPHPFSTTEWPPPSEALCCRVCILLDELSAETSTWSYQPARGRLPQTTPLPHGEGAPLLGSPGSVWICAGPAWLTNSSGAGAFWKQEDAMARYKYTQAPPEDRAPNWVRMLQVDFLREHVAREETVAGLEGVQAAAEEAVQREVTGKYSLF